MARSDRRPTISAVLIVKDEEAVLDTCLSSVTWCDEIVVYDTGSTDGTVEIARRYTDQVVEGYWDNDFGAARNRALAHASGDWALIIDADEMFTGDPWALRSRLGKDGGTAHTLVIAAPDDSALSNAETIPSIRVFRREVHRYAGALHEQVVTIPGCGVPSVVIALANCRLLHSGYAAKVFQAKGKAQRNLEVARAELAAAVAADAPAEKVLLIRANLARSLVAADQVAQALELAEEIFAQSPRDASYVVVLARAMGSAAQMTGRYEDSDRWLARWVAGTPHPAWAWARWAEYYRQRDDAQGVLDALDHVPWTTVNESQQRLERGRLALLEVWALRVTGRRREAAAAAVKAARAGYVPGTPQDLVMVFEEVRRPITDVLEPLSADAWRMLSGLSLAGSYGLRLLKAMHDVRPGSTAVLTCVAAHGARMTIPQAMDWSARIRAGGLTELCPLRTIAGSTALNPCDRAVAAAVAIQAYQDASVVPDLEDALSQVPAEQEVALAALLDQVAPGLLAST